MSKQITRAELADMGIYEFFDLIAKANVTDVTVIKKTLENIKSDCLKLFDDFKKKAFSENIKQEDFDEYFTKMVQSFAMAMYIDKKLEVCEQRRIDLIPKCFKENA